MGKGNFYDQKLALQSGMPLRLMRY